MSNLPSSTRVLSAFGLISFSMAAFLAGCGGGGGSTAPTPAVTQGPTLGYTCAGATGGVAYIPDGAALPNSNSSAPGSLTIIPFETTSGAIAKACPQTILRLPNSINDLSISPAGIAVALQSNNTFIGIPQLVAGGSAFSNQIPQPFPTPSGIPFVGYSLSMAANGNSAFAIGTGFQGFVGLNNLFNLAPTPLPTSATAAPSSAPTSAGATPTPTVTQTPVPFAGLISYADVASNSSASTGLLPASGVRTSGALGPNATTILVRGSDLATFQLYPQLQGYYVTFPADSGAVDIASPPPNGIDTTLGFPGGTPPPGNAGRGLIAFYPGDASQAVIGQTTSALQATHVTNLPNGINKSGQFSVPSTNGATKITSIAVTPNGSYAVIGTDSGVYLENLSTNPSTAATTSITSGAILSVGVSPDGNWVLVQTGQSLNVYPFTNDTIGTLAQGFTLPAQSTGDYLVVR